MLFTCAKSRVQPRLLLNSRPFKQKTPLISSSFPAGINPMPMAGNVVPGNGGTRVSLWLHSAGSFKHWPLLSFSTILSE